MIAMKHVRWRKQYCNETCSLKKTILQIWTREFVVFNYYASVLKLKTIFKLLLFVCQSQRSSTNELFVKTIFKESHDILVSWLIKYFLLTPKPVLKLDISYPFISVILGKRRNRPQLQDALFGNVVLVIHIIEEH